MKNVVAALCAVLFLALTGCASVDPFEDLSLIDPLGIVRVTSNTEIDWPDDSDNSLGGSLLGAVANKVINETKNEDVSSILSRADILVDEADMALRQVLGEVGTISVVEKDVILASDAYARIDDSQNIRNTNSISAEGYKYFFLSDEEKFPQRLYAETGIKGQLYIEFSFEKFMDTGVEKNGMMAVGVNLMIELTDETGEKLAYRSYWAQSEDTVPVVAGLYEPDEMMALFPPVIDEVCRDFAAEFIR